MYFPVAAPDGTASVSGTDLDSFGCSVKSFSPKRTQTAGTVRCGPVETRSTWTRYADVTVPVLTTYSAGNGYVWPGWAGEVNSTGLAPTPAPTSASAPTGVASAN